MDSVLSCHVVPDLAATFVLDNIVYFRSNDDDTVVCKYSEQDLVTCVVIGLIIVPIDLGGEDAGCLHRHVVQRRPDCSCAYSSCVARCQRHNDGVCIRIADDEGRECPPRPVGIVELWRQSNKSDKTW